MTLASGPGPDAALLAAGTVRRAVDRREALISLVALCACGSAAAAQQRLARWDARRPTPVLELMSIEGERVSLRSLLGKVVLINFWASWCEPCLAEMPQLARLARRHAGDGELIVLGVNYGEGRAAIRRFSDSMALGFPMLRDPDGSAFHAWSGGVLPSSVLVSRTGKARYAVEGEFDWESMPAVAALERLLSEESA